MSNNKTIVLGLGVSGLAAAEFLLSRGKAVLGVDSNRAHLETSEEIHRLQKQGLVCQLDTLPLLWEDVEELIVSPGVSRQHPIYQGAHKRGIPIIGEAELALPHFKQPLVAVTGTNGKTTVTLLVEHILKTAGIKARALGNVGTSLCSYLLHSDDTEAFVVELSSYQLETMNTPVFAAAALLNITPDHLDRYTGMQEYAEAKFRLQDLLKEGGSFFVQKEAVCQFASMVKEGAQIFGMEKTADLYTEKSALYYQGKRECVLPQGTFARHDLENILAAWALCRPFSLTSELFSTAVATFRKPPHRIEFVKEWAGVSFYDDSKGTNIDAVIQAVAGMKGAVVLIAGGVDKGASYLLWKEAFTGKVKKIVAIGAAAPKMHGELSAYFSVEIASSLEAAVQIAAKEATRGDCVLLSPGCSSFDMFRDYAHRGEEFQRIVRQLGVSS